jgi:phage shock protein A
MEIDLTNKTKAEQLQVIKRAAAELAYAVDTFQNKDVSGAVDERMRGLQNAAGDLIQSINSMNELPQQVQPTDDLREQAERFQDDTQPKRNPRQRVKDISEDEAESAFERMRDKLQESVAETGEVPPMEEFIKNSLEQ